MSPPSRNGLDVMKTEYFRFVVPGRLEYRDAARAFLAYICDRLVHRGEIPEDLGHRVISAFVEAFNNSVIHAYREVEPGPIEVDLEVRDTGLLIRVIDYGQAFRADLVPEPDLDALPEGGLGLYIIREFMDDVRYERLEDRNALSMEMRFESAADEPHSAV